MSTWQSTFQPLLSVWPTLGLVVLVGVLLGALYRREHNGVLLGLRVITLGLLGMMGTRWTLTQTIFLEPNVWILVDDSDSMQFSSEDSWAARIPTRQEKAENILRKIVPPLEENQTVHVRKLSELLALSSQKDSPLGDALEHLSQGALESTGQYPAAVVMLSDGVVTAGQSLAATGMAAEKRGTRMYPVTLGAAKPLPELRLEVSETMANRTLTQGESATIPVQLVFRRLEKTPVSVRLVSADSETLATAEQTLSARSDDTAWHSVEAATLTWMPPGPGRYTLWIEAQAHTKDGGTPWKETFLQDRIPVEIQVAERTRRVFLAAAKPSWEFRYLQNLLKREPSMALETWLASASEHWAEQDSAARATFPDAETLDTFDVLILFADLAAEKLPTETVARFASKHVVLCVAGAEHRLATWRGTPLEKILPFPSSNLGVETGEARVELTLLGRNSAGFQGSTLVEAMSDVGRKLWRVPRFLRVVHPLPGSQTLAEFVGKDDSQAYPAILQAPIDEGVVRFHAWDGTWRWRWRNDETLFKQYWVTTIHQLCRTLDTGKEQNVPPSEKSEASEASEKVDATIKTIERRRTPEFLRTEADPDAMRQLAQLSGGLTYTARQIDTLATDVTLQLQTRSTLSDQQMEATESRYPLWSHPATFFLLFLLLGGQWAVARSKTNV